jgi:hypothetical protein
MTRLGLIALAVVLSGCALLERERTENLLAKSGFQMRAATAADSDLPAHDFVEQWDGEKTVYTYADLRACRCVYSGGSAQYERYRWLEARDNVLREVDGNEMSLESFEQP